MHRNCFFDMPSPLDSQNCPRFSFFFYRTKIGSILKKLERFFDFCDFHDFHQKWMRFSHDSSLFPRYGIDFWGSGVAKIAKMKLALKSPPWAPLTPGTTLESILGVLRKLWPFFWGSCFFPPCNLNGIWKSTRQRMACIFFSRKYPFSANREGLMKMVKKKIFPQ